MAAPPASTTGAVPGSVATASQRPGDLWGRAADYWVLQALRTWRASAFSAFLAPLLFLATLGFGLGALVDRGDGVGVPFVQFVAPGILAATAMQTAAGESTFPVMGAIKWQRQYHAMLAAPLGVVDVLLGHLAVVVARTVAGAAVFLAVAAAFGVWQSWWVLLAVPVAVLIALAHAAPTMAFAATQQDAGGFNLLFRFVLMPMFLFSGTFFPVSQLPDWLEPVAWVMPVWHGVELVRASSLGGMGAGTAALHVAYLSLWAVVGLWLARRSFVRRLSE